MTSLNRRRFCSSLLAGAAISAAGLPLSVHASEMTIGKGQKLTIFSDGTMTLPVSMLFSQAPKDQLDDILAAQNQTKEALSRPLNVVLLEDGDRKILFDAGSGTNFLSGLGELPVALEDAGVELSDITDIVFTHAHPDHIWGIMDDFDDLLMADANYHISAQEWDFWDSDDALAAMPAGRENFAVGAKSRFDLIRDQIQLFTFGDEVLPGIEGIDSRGHTPGHASFVIHGGDRPVMIVGDALTHPIISFEHSDWLNDSDMDPEQAVATRKALLGRAASDNMVISGYHLAGGFGEVEKTASAWQYITGQNITG